MKESSATGELKVAFAQHANALMTRQKIEAAVNGVSQVPLDEESIETVRRELEDCLARRILGEASEKEETEARRALENAERAFDQRSEERRARKLENDGLNRRLATAQAAEEAAAEALLIAQQSWLHEEQRKADEEYTKLAEELERQYRRVHMCADALRRRGGALRRPPADIEIPALGPASAAVALAKYGQPYGTALLCNGDRACPKSGENEVDDELAAVTAAKEVHGVKRFARMLTDLAAG